MYAFAESRSKGTSIDVLQKTSKSNQQSKTKISNVLIKETQIQPNIKQLIQASKNTGQVKYQENKLGKMIQKKYMDVPENNNLVIQRTPIPDGDHYKDDTYTALKLEKIRDHLYRVMEGQDQGSYVYLEDGVYDIVTITDAATYTFEYTSNSINLAHYTTAPEPGTHYNSKQGTLVDISTLHPGRDIHECPRMETAVNGLTIVPAMQAGIFFDPVQVNRTQNIINGNHRYYASVQCGYQQIPIVIV